MTGSVLLHTRETDAPCLEAQPLLVVEDDDMMRLFLEEYLGQTYHVVAKTEGTEALAWLRDGHEAALVIVDLAMPGMDGFAFIRELRADATLYRLPVMVLSGSEKSEDRVRCLRLGADDFIVKPFNPEELMVRVENLFRRLGWNTPYLPCPMHDKLKAPSTIHIRPMFNSLSSTYRP